MLKRILQLFLMVLLILNIFFVNTNYCFAQEKNTTAQEINTKLSVFANESGYGKPVSPGELVGQVLSVIYALLGAGALAFIVYAGFLWMFAAGNQERIDKAQSIIKNAVIGLVILFSAYLITNFVITALSGGL
jgi:hypothetical protein